MAFQENSSWVNLALFAAAAVAIWWAGTRLESRANQISKRIGLGQAFTGMLLLAVTTSLPELVTTFTAVVLLDNPTLAVHNLLGGVAMQTALIAVADAGKRQPGSITLLSPSFVLLIEAVGLLLLLQIVVAGISTQGVPTLYGVSAWSVLLLAVYVGMMLAVYRQRAHGPWVPSRMDELPREICDELEHGESSDGDDASGTRPPLSRLWLQFSALGLIVLIGGWLAAQTADSLAEQTGLGPAFLGATLLAIATSFPELSSTLAAVRANRPTTAISNVLGSNACDVTLLVFADVLYRESAILSHAEPSVVFVAATGAAMTCIYLWSLLQRGTRSVFGIGWDSLAVLGLYVGCMAVLYVIT